MKHNLLTTALFAILALCSVQAQTVTTIASGFNNPNGLQLDNQGNLWLTTTGTGQNDGRVFFIMPDNTVHRAIIELPSEVNPANGETGGAWRTYLMPNNRLMVVVGEGTQPLSGSLLTYDMSDFWPGSQPQTIHDHESVFNVQDFVHGQGIVNSNPYSVAWDDAGTMFIVDAGANALLRRDPVTNELSIFSAFEKMTNPLPFGPPKIDPVPTKVISDGANGFYVATLTGFPFVPGMATVYHIAADGTQTPFATGLSMVVDIAMDPTDKNLVALQYGSFGPMGFEPKSAKVVKLFDDGSSKVMYEDFGPSASMAIDPAGNIYVSNLTNPYSSDVLKLSPSVVVSRDAQPSGVTVYPNPTTGLLNIRVEKLDAQETNLALYDMFGRTVMSQQISNTNTTLDVSTLQAGQYIVETRSGDKREVQRFVKM